MKSRTFFATATVVCVLLASPAVHAAPTSIHAPLNAMFAKEKTVKLSLHNGSTASVELRVGADLVTLTAGQSVSLNLPVGTRIVANSDTLSVKAGTLITEVSKELSGAVLTLK